MNETPRQWSVLSLLDWTTGHLAQRGFDEARLHVELLLAHVLRLRRLDLYLQFDRPLTQDELATFRALYERRLKHEPLQYILGETEFMGLPLFVTPGVLIPRPETELLVEEALKILKERDASEREVLDIGCGAGNIGLPIAKELPTARVVGLDNADAAIALARRNAERLGVTNIEFRRQDVLAEGFGDHRYDMILSNPPYIPAGEMASLQEEVRLFEPRQALTDEHDGLTLYRRIAAIVQSGMKNDGFLGVEVGHDQSAVVTRLMQGAGLSNVHSARDYAGIERVIFARKGER